MKNTEFNDTIIRGLNNRSDVKVVDVWGLTITLIVKSITFFDVLPKGFKWEPKTAFLESEKLFLILDTKDFIKPLFMVKSNGYEQIVLNPENLEENEDEFFKKVGYFPEMLVSNDSELDVNFTLVNAKRYSDIEALF